MKLYGAIDNKRLIAVHTEKEVIKKFKTDYDRCNNKNLTICKLSKKEKMKDIKVSDLYLIRYGDTYIQQRFLYIMELDDEQLAYDLRYAHDILNRIMTNIKDDKKMKSLIKADFIILEQLEELNEYVPNIEELVARDTEYERFRFLSD